MPSRDLDSASVRDALRALRFDKPLDASPLLDLAAVTDRLRVEGLPDTLDQRAWALSALLAETAWAYAARARGVDHSVDRRDLGPADEIDLLSADFARGHQELEAWSLLHYRYFGLGRRELRDVAARLGVSRKTLTRRLARGHALLAQALEERERTAAARASRLRGLPRSLSSFVGREREIADIRDLLAAHRLVTLTGPGGIGKSRIALRVAHELASSYADGAWFVDLSVVDDGRMVPHAFVVALRISGSGQGPLADQIAEHLQGRRALLLVDNAEHLVVATSQLIGSVLERCPRVQVLATSREELHVSGQARYVVPHMGLPDLSAAAPGLGWDQADAVRLFVGRAGMSGHDRRFAEEDMTRVARVCTELEGLPLAIEMAAARLRHLTLDELESRLADRFLLLRDGRRAARPVHVTLEATIDWSYDLLDPAESALLRRLAVFRGGWSVASAEAVCSDAELQEASVLELIDRLEAKSLVQVASAPGRRRFEMLETVRTYVLTKLRERGGEEAILERHLEHMISIAEEPGSSAEEQRAWLDLIEGEHANVRAAIVWASESGRAAAALELCRRAWLLWYARGRAADGIDALQTALASAQPDLDAQLHAAALERLGSLLLAVGDLEGAEQALTQSVARFEEAGTDRGLNWAERYLGLLHEYRGDFEGATALYERSLRRSRRCGDIHGEVAVLQDLGILATHEGELANAKRLLLDSLRLARASGPERAVAAAHRHLGIVHHYLGEHATAAEHYEKDLEYQVRIDDPVSIANAHGNLGTAAEHLGDLERARSLYLDALACLRDVGVDRILPSTLLNLGYVEQRLGDGSSARRRYREALALAERMGLARYQALAHKRLASLAVSEGDGVAARASADQSLRLFHQVGVQRNVADALQICARAAWLTGEPARAMRLTGAAEAAFGRLEEPISAGSQIGLDKLRARAQEETSLDAPPELEAGRLLSTNEAVAYALGETSWEDTAG